MKLVVGGEAMFFLALIMAYVYLSFVSGYNHNQQQQLSIRSTGLFSILLILSSGSLLLAERSYSKGNIRMVKIFLLTTLVLGTIFLFGQAKEYVHLIHEQQITLSNSLFGTGFYTLTGFHGLHVFIGLIILSVLFIMSLLGDFNKPGSSVIATAGIYWHFVDVVWIIVFTVVYIIPKTNLLH